MLVLTYHALLDLDHVTIHKFLTPNMTSLVTHNISQCSIQQRQTFFTSFMSTFASTGFPGAQFTTLHLIFYAVSLFKSNFGLS